MRNLTKGLAQMVHVTSIGCPQTNPRHQTLQVVDSLKGRNQIETFKIVRHELGDLMVALAQKAFVNQGLF